MKFIQYQIEDIARMALTDGGIKGWAPGLGKTLVMYTWPALKVGFRKPDTSHFAPRTPFGLHPLAPVLMVAPGGLHDQIANDGEEHFKVRPTRLYSRETFFQLSTLNPRTGKRELPPGYYLTSYQDLGLNGVAPFPKEPAEDMVTEGQVQDWFEHRGEIYRDCYDRFEATPDCTLAELRSKYFRLRKMYTNEAVRIHLDAAWQVLERVTPSHSSHRSYASLSADQKAFMRSEAMRHYHRLYQAHIGDTRWHSTTPDTSHPAPSHSFKVKCVYSPSLADECQDAFGAAVVDEGTRVKGEETFIGLGVRQITAPHRLVLTGTPIKNRLPDIFRLAWWATGGKQHASSNPRFPYDDTAEAVSDFSKEFLISERNLSKEEESNRRYVKLTPQICNIHRLWKILSPIVLRRRKEDCGEQIAPKIKHLVRVPMGKYQAEVYKYHLKAFYADRNGLPAVGARLTALRIAAANPASILLKDKPSEDNKPIPGIPRSAYTYTPKLSAQLHIILDALQRREQIVLFSSFLDALDALGARLSEAGIPHVVLDGRVSPAKRGRLANEFKKGPERSQFQVMLAGEECMAEGYSFHLANNAVRSAYSWAYDKGAQAIERVHRINSKKPVNSFGVLCEGTIDRRLEGLNDEKGDASDLVLDGKLFGENSTEVSLAEILKEAYDTFGRAGEYVDERELEKEWPQLRAQLAAAARNFKHPVADPLPENVIALPSYPSDTSDLLPTLNFAPAEAFADLPLWQLA